MTYIIRQNPEFEMTEVRVKPFRVHKHHTLDEYFVKKNFGGVVHMSLNGHQSVIKKKSFSNKYLLDRLTEYLDRYSIKYRMI